MLVKLPFFKSFHARLAQRFLSNAALLFGNFEGFCLNFKAIFCTLCLSNFPFSNPEKIEQCISYEVVRIATLLFGVLPFVVVVLQA